MSDKIVSITIHVIVDDVGVLSKPYEKEWPVGTKLCCNVICH